MSHTGDSGYEDSPKRVKYDRQLRLWDDHGQYALEASHICLINATATGTEILKSLVLPGVGAFTILDCQTVEGRDVGSNFFLNKDSIGKSRAKIATEHLLELNPDVRGEFVEETVECILQAEPSFFSAFTVVIATNLRKSTLLTLADKLWNQQIPLLVCRVFGMVGCLRLQFNERTIIESRPENEFHDLRLDRPFPALREYVDSLDLEHLSDIEYAHVPYVVILLKYLDRWKSQNSEEMPKNLKEKNLLKAEIIKGMRKKNDENFEEACKAVNRCIVKYSLPSETDHIMKNSKCNNLSNDSKPFWILVRALKEFVNNEGEGYLPVRGVIPDMTSDTQNYIKLQNIYKQKAEEDARLVYKRVQNILSSLGKSQNFITETEVKVFCKNAYCLRILCGQPISNEYNPKTSKIQSLISNLEHEDNDIIFYILIGAADKFCEEFGRYPGQNDDVESDILKLKNCALSLCQELQCPPVMKDDYVHEMCRFGASELHSVAAFIGGCAAQEVIKLITGQYVPFNNTLIYNAINQSTSIFYL